MRFGVTVVSLALGAGVSCVSCASASFCDSSDDGSWVQVWGDEFEGDELDDTKWTKMTSDEGTVGGPIRPDEGTRTHSKDGGAAGGGGVYHDNNASPPLPFSPCPLPVPHRNLR